MSRHWCATPRRCTEELPQGLPPHRRHRGGRHQVAARTEGLRTGQAVPDVLGAGRLARPAPGHEGMGRQVQRQVRRRLGRLPRARLQARQGEGLDSARRAAHAAAGVDGVLGLDPRGRKAVPAPPDGSLRRLHRARRLQRRPRHRRDRAAGQARQHADLLHLGRQRLLGRRPERHHQRTAGAERHSDQDLAAPRRVEGTRRARCAGRPEDRQHVSRRLGVGGQHALPVDQAGRRAFRRHPPTDGRRLAQGHQARRDAASAVPPCHRHRADDLRAARRSRRPRWSTASSRTRSTA